MTTDSRSFLPHVLLVDDDAELLKLIGAYMEDDGFRVSTAGDGESAIAAAIALSPDIAVVDVMMPGFSGIEVLRRIRARSAMPVLMLTARGDEESRVLGLELGADDFVAKPCSSRELCARIRAILRRTLSAPAIGGQFEGEAVRVGRLILYPGRRIVTWAGETVSLTNAEYNLLEILIQQAGQAVSKAVLSERGLGRPYARFDRAIDVHLSSVRRKLAPMPDGRPRIQAVLRKGYQLLVD